MNQLVPIVVTAGVSAAGRLISSTAGQVGKAFTQWLQPSGDADAGIREKSRETGGGAGTMELSASGMAVASRVAHESLEARAEQLLARVKRVLDDAGLSWKEPLRIEVAGGEVRVQSGERDLGELVAARLELDRPLVERAVEFARRAFPGAERVAVELAPDGTWSAVEA